MSNASYETVANVNKEASLCISEDLIVGIDISCNTNDESVMIVSRRGFHGLKDMNTILGKEAEELYEKLTGKKIPERKINLEKEIK